ncbi:MAG: hypothetical protein ACRDNB_01650, partial [Gaiellaceae bacterium]
MIRSAAVALLVLGVAGCGGGDEGLPAVDDTGPDTTAAASCTPGVHELVLANGQAAQMWITPGDGARALVGVLHGAGGSPAS